MAETKHEVVKAGPVVEGTCKWFRRDRGFLLVGGKDVFVHVTALKERGAQPKDGGRVRCRVGRHLKDGVDVGEAATDVEVIDVFVRENKAA